MQGIMKMMASAGVTPGPVTLAEGVVYKTAPTSTPWNTLQTFPNVTLTTPPGATRWVYVYFNGFYGGISQTTWTPRVNGIAMTSGPGGLWRALVPAGATASITLNNTVGGGTYAMCLGAAVWTVVNPVTPAPTYAQLNTSTNTAAAVSVSGTPFTPPLLVGSTFLVASTASQPSANAPRTLNPITSSLGTLGVQKVGSATGAGAGSFTLRISSNATVGGLVPTTTASAAAASTADTIRLLGWTIK